MTQERFPAIDRMLDRAEALRNSVRKKLPWESVAEHLGYSEQFLKVLLLKRRPGVFNPSAQERRILEGKLLKEMVTAGALDEDMAWVFCIQPRSARRKAARLGFSKDMRKEIRDAMKNSDEYQRGREIILRFMKWYGFLLPPEMSRRIIERYT